MLEFDEGDAGCGTTRMVLERYVEAELDAGVPFPGVALHLTMCPACRTDHDGLLALIEHQRRRTR